MLPAGFGLAVCGTSTVAVAAALLRFGVRDFVLHTGAGGPMSLVATGATSTAAALLCWLQLARQITRPGRRTPSG